MSRCITAIAICSLAFTAGADELLVPSVFPTIQDAADAALNGDEIVVSPGVYAGFLAATDVTVRGDGVSPEGVIITGGITAFDAIALENMRITGGANLTSGNSRVSNCIVNFVGIEFNFPSSGLVEDTLFEGCADTALILADAGFTVRRCDFINNSTSGNGGAIRVTDSTLDIDDCSFTTNHANGISGAIHASSFAVELEIDNSIFSGNTADMNAGAVFFSNSLGGQCILFQCDFVGNSSPGDTGAVSISSSEDSVPPGSVNGCSFRGNNAGAGGAALRFGNLPASPVASTEFCGNTPADIVGSFFDVGGNSFATACDCLADVNGDGALTPTDFTAWINAFNNNLPECDQNSDGSCTPTDFTAWIANYNAGC